MSSTTRILLLTNSEHGQANVHLAVAHAILELGQSDNQDVEVHIGSFGLLEKTVTTTSQYAVQACPGVRPIVFHKIRGVDMVAAWSRPEIGLEQYMGLRPSFLNTPKFLKLLVQTTSPWDGEEFIEIFRSVVDVIEDVKPDMIAIDPAFSPAITACRQSGRNFFILAPNTSKDFTVSFQGSAVFWKYPALASALPYPIPWYLVPLNIYFVICALVFTVFDKSNETLRAYVKQHTDAEVTTLNNLNRRPPPGVKYLVASRPELEFPLSVPDHIVSCGPMVRPAPSVREVDPDLADWIARGPTVYINFGTHLQLTEWHALEIGKAIKQLFATAEGQKDPALGDLQVLWKLSKRGDFEVHEPDCRIHSLLDEYLDSDRVRIVKWVGPEPSAVLKEGNIVCSVHHGGANSFFEAASAGTPQIVLPPWIDCFDFANRAELLDIGIWGNRDAVPVCYARELGPLLIKVVVGEAAERFKRRAAELGDVCMENGGGRAIAARAILDAVADAVAETEKASE